MTNAATEYFRSMPTLRTKRLILRKLTLADAADMFAYASNPLTTCYTTWSAHKSIDESRAFLTHAVNQYENGRAVGYGVVDLASNHLIGTCGLASWTDQHDRGELGYAIAAPYWGNGIATEAARAAIEMAFRVLPMNRLQSCCHVGNIGSARVMEKLGMSFEGIFRQHFKFQGRYQDLRYYALLRSEWDAQTARERIM